MSATKIDAAKLPGPYEVVLATEVSMYINDDDLTALYAYINRCTDDGAYLYLQDTTSLLETRLTLKDFDSKELKVKYSAIYRTRNEYEAFFAKNLPEFVIMENGSALLLDKDSGAREETNARYWLMRKGSKT
jgi:hypothetical protein